MLRFERSFDYELIRRIITHPKIYKWMHSDGAASPEDYRPPEMPEIWYVLVKDAEAVLGLFLLVPQTSVCFQVHTCLLPEVRSHAVEIYRCGIEWLWANTPAAALVGITPAYNFAALRIAREAGMKDVGVISRSLLKFGKLHDQIVLSIGRNHHG